MRHVPADGRETGLLERFLKVGLVHPGGRVKFTIYPAYIRNPRQRHNSLRRRRGLFLFLLLFISFLFVTSFGIGIGHLCHYIVCKSLYWPYVLFISLGIIVQGRGRFSRSCLASYTNVIGASLETCLCFPSRSWPAGSVPVPLGRNIVFAARESDIQESEFTLCRQRAGASSSLREIERGRCVAFLSLGADRYALGGPSRYGLAVSVSCCAGWHLGLGLRARRGWVGWGRRKAGR